MGQGSVSDVMKQRRGEGVAHADRGEAVFGNEGSIQSAQAVDELFHDECGTDGMGEASVFGAWVCEGGEAELADTAQALDFSRFEQAFDDLFFCGFEGDQSVYGVSKDHERDAWFVEQRDVCRAGLGVQGTEALDFRLCFRLLVSVQLGSCASHRTREPRW